MKSPSSEICKTHLDVVLKKLVKLTVLRAGVVVDKTTSRAPLQLSYALMLLFNEI